MRYCRPNLEWAYWKEWLYSFTLSPRRAEISDVGDKVTAPGEGEKQLYSNKQSEVKDYSFW